MPNFLLEKFTFGLPQPEDHEAAVLALIRIN
jgi:hypothetical protein